MSILTRLVLFTLLTKTLAAQSAMDYLLPGPTVYDTTIPTPGQVLGHEVGEWHVSHDKLVYYMTLVASKSPRVNIVEYGRTYENRPLLLLAITSPQNQENLEKLRQEHALISDPSRSDQLNLDELPGQIS